MNRKIILHLCADIGSDSMPYRENGYDVRCIGKSIGVENYHPPKNVYGIIANPPCIMFSFARTNAKKSRDLEEGMFLVKECLRIIWECQFQIKKDVQRTPPLKFWMLENPNGMLKWFLGKPVLLYSPEEYGDIYQKQTCLWGYFKIPEKNKIELSPEQKRLARSNSQPIHPEAYGKLTRQDRRSIASEKFAQAFYEANR